MSSSENENSDGFQIKKQKESQKQKNYRLRKKKELEKHSQYKQKDKKRLNRKEKNEELDKISIRFEKVKRSNTFIVYMANIIFLLATRIERY